MIKLFAIILSTLLISASAQAESVVSVNSLNYPVWVERNQQLLPLAPGDALNSGDIVKTGSQGRAWLSMLDGSVVKLGEQAEFKIASAGYEEKEDNSLLSATLEVVKGAFRFTTSFFTPQRKTPHQVNLKIGAITAGLRGTDIWGRSTEVEDFVTLLEGSIEMSADNEATTILSEPLSLYLKKRGQAVEPISRVDMEKVEQFGLETELSNELGIATSEGEYELVLMSLTNAELVNEVLIRFHQAGYAVEVISLEINNKTFNRFILRGFVSLETATNLTTRLEDEFSLQSVWVKKRSF